MSTRVAMSRQTNSGLRQESRPQFGVLGLLTSGGKNFKDDRSGDVAVVFGLTAVIMMLFVGAAVDFGRWLHASKQTRTAIDAAVLAGGRVLQVQGSSTAGIAAAKIVAKKYYDENVKSRISVVNDTITFDATPGRDGFTASGNAFIQTPLLNVISVLGLTNLDKLALVNTSGTGFSVAKLKVGGNAENSLEISMMLDTSGSMAGDKIVDMKAAAKDLVDIVVWDNQTTYTSKVAIAPFSADVILPSTLNLGARGNPPLTKIVTGTCTSGSGSNRRTVSCPVTYKHTNCVSERTGTNRYTDAAPGTGNFVSTVYSTTGSSPTQGNCSQHSANAIVPLSNNKTALKAAIDGLRVAGATAGHLGTAWAWYTISPDWASIMPSGSKPAAYGTAKLTKIAILMTDGEYNTQYDVNGIQTGSNGAGSQANGSSVNQARALCTAMKAKGITVYTVGFELGSNSTATSTLQFCASTPGTYYNAENGDQLKQAFRDIALKISDLYLSQ